MLPSPTVSCQAVVPERGSFSYSQLLIKHCSFFWSDVS